MNIIKQTRDQMIKVLLGRVSVPRGLVELHQYFRMNDPIHFRNMKTVIISLILILLVGAGCVEPKQDNANSGVSVTGVVSAGRFGGTEKACEFSDEANVSDRIECNVGSVDLAVVNDAGESIWLDAYQCDAIEYFVKETGGKSVGYETTNCTSGIVVGNAYTFEGILEERKNQWYMGKQQDEIWLLNAVTK